MTVKELRDFPPRADLLTEIYTPLPQVTASINWEAIDVDATCKQALESLSTALEQVDEDALNNIFLSHGSYWRDTIALTSHLRTFKDCNRIVPALAELSSRRRISSISIVPASGIIATASISLVSSNCCTIH